VPFSKFDPQRDLSKEDPLAANSPSAARRAWILKWGVRITNAMVLLGFLLIVYWLWKG